MMKQRRSNLRQYTLFLFTTLVSLSTFALTGGGGGNVLDEYSRSGGQATTQESLGLSCTVYRPISLGNNHPVIIWGNGTGTSPMSYATLLRHWASWGFVVVAANTSNAGTGTDMIACLNAIYQARGSSLSDQIGTTGHSQGGGGAIMAGRDGRVDTTAPIQPYTIGLGHRPSSQGQQNGPMLLLSGSIDTVAGPTLNQSPVYSRVNTPVFWASSVGADHLEPIYDGGDYRGITTAWFLYQLKNDTDAASLFEGANCDLCNLSAWTVQKKGL